jgi:hypothetical protein
MCYVSPGVLPYGRSASTPCATHQLDIVPVSSWLSSEEVPAPEDESLATASASMDGTGMTFELWIIWSREPSLLCVCAHTYELVHGDYLEPHTEIRARASPRYIPFPNIMWSARAETGRPVWAWHGATLLLRTLPTVDELRRIIIERAQNGDDLDAFMLGEQVQQAPDLLDDDAFQDSLPWGKLRIVCFSPSETTHTCDLAVPKELAQQTTVEVVLLDAALGHVFVQEQTPSENAPEQWYFYYLAYA